MSTNQTPNYALSQWERTDKIQMEDFNSDNAKIDAAIKAVDARADGLEQGLSEQAAAIAKLGNCMLYTTTYTGTGGETTRRLTFPKRPVLVCVMSMSPSTCIMTALYGTASGTVFSSSMGRDISLSWSGNSLSWTNSWLNSGNYTVVALLDASK